MALPVLERVERRRRRRRGRRWPLALLLAFAVLAAVAGWRLWPSSAPPASPQRTAPPPARAAARSAPEGPPLLVFGGRPLAPHRFRPRLSARTAILVHANTRRLLGA